MSEAKFLILGFNVEGSNDRFTRQTCTTADSLSAAMLIGAHRLTSCDGLIIVERTETGFDLVGKVGLGQNPYFARYALAELIFGIWPLPSVEEAILKDAVTPR